MARIGESLPHKGGAAGSEPVELGSGMGVAHKGRGALSSPAGRFEKISFERDYEQEPATDPPPGTEFFRDTTRTAIAYNSSPDIPFDASINPYRGCEHGCVYCYARPSHEFLGLSAGLDFETKIMVKEDAPELLRRELSARRWKPQVISMSGVTDPYQPVETRLRLTRRCLEVLAEFMNPVMIVTKNELVTRDIDILGRMASDGAAAVFVSVTTLDPALCGKLEPRTSRPERRLKAIEALSAAGIPTGVLVAPVIPGLTDHEIPAIVEAIARAGARFAGYVPLRLPGAVAEQFSDWLGVHTPALKGKVLSRQLSMKGGRLNDPAFGSRMRGQGAFAGQIEGLFDMACRKHGVARGGPRLSAAGFRVPTVPGGQLTLFCD